LLSSPSQGRMGPWAWAYIIAVITGALAILWGTWPPIDAHRWHEVIAFAVLIFVCESMPIILPRGNVTISVGYTVIYAAILTFGAPVAAWLAALATIRPMELKGNVSIEKVLFNRAQLAITAAASGLAYTALGGVPGQLDVVANLGAIIAAALVYSLVNPFTVIFVVSLTERVSIWRIWVTDFQWIFQRYLALTPLGVIVAEVYTRVGIGGVLLVFLPLVLASYSLRLYAQTRSAYAATIQAMVAAIEARDPYTAGHSRRVAYYTVATARALRLSGDWISRLEFAAWLHDLGKLAVPDSILRKRGPLTQAERNLMKQHPRRAAVILKPIQPLSQDLDVIVHHHEWWNGEGYPDGLSGKDIPLGSRVLAIADAFEAMTSARPYRGPMSKEEAFSELRRNAGVQFDPSLVEVFIEAVQAIPAEVEPSLEAPDLALQEEHAMLDEAAAAADGAQEPGVYVTGGEPEATDRREVAESNPSKGS